MAWAAGGQTTKNQGACQLSMVRGGQSYRARQQHSICQGVNFQTLLACLKTLVRALWVAFVLQFLAPLLWSFEPLLLPSCERI